MTTEIVFGLNGRDTMVVGLGTDAVIEAINVDKQTRSRK